MVPTDKEIKDAVKEKYGGLARGQGKSCCAPSATSCSCSSSAGTADAATLYAGEDLSGIPAEAAGFSLGCGNPLALAGLKEGETVLDLGSGGGLDCFLAAKKVGASGKVIGLDMTRDMIKLARQNAEKMKATNVEFRLGEMEYMPIEDASVDVIISNCVVNLSPDKDAVFKEAFRVLRPGGRLSISDIVWLAPVPDAVRASLDEWAGCVAGALEETTYLDKIKSAGFTDITGERSMYDVGDAGEAEIGGMKASELAKKVASVRVQATKPRRRTHRPDSGF